jgi:hypothetical protein
MVHIHRAGKVFYCPLKSNRKVDDSQGKNPYKAVSALDWFDDEGLRGKIVKIHEFPNDCKVKLFRVAATNRTEYVVTNDLSQDSAVAVRYLQHPLKNRAIPPGSQATTRTGKMSMPQGPCPKEPYRLRYTRLALPDKSSQEAKNKRLCIEKKSSF